MILIDSLRHFHPNRIQYRVQNILKYDEWVKRSCRNLTGDVSFNICVIVTYGKSILFFPKVNFTWVLL